MRAAVFIFIGLLLNELQPAQGQGEKCYRDTRCRRADKGRGRAAWFLKRGSSTCYKTWVTGCKNCGMRSLFDCKHWCISDD
uniref:Putative secreted protein n=1 Tax=Amblyomma americanum TaxID=6943 RepID=A0A0C9RVM4_AMBAM